MKRIAGISLVLTSTIIVALLSGCTSKESTESETRETKSATTQSLNLEVNRVLEANGLSGLSTKELINKLDQTPLDQRSENLMVSVRPNETLVTSGEGSEQTLKMSDDEFYLSVAPYIDSTHECYYHSLTTCTGEIRNKEINVKITKDDGTVIVNEPMVTFDNGFLGLWIPKNISGNIEVEYEGRTATDSISTIKADDPTCLTTLKLI